MASGLTYEGVDYLAQLVAGGVATPINAAYIEFLNGAAPTAPEDITDGREYFADLETDDDPTHGYVRVPVAVSGYAGTDEGLDSNQIGFVAVCRDDSAAYGALFGTDNDSRVFGIALVAAVDWGDRTEDVVVARAYVTPQTKVTGQHLSILWDFTLPVTLVGPEVVS
jgi:hypothetical protein